ncbi:unnamed protein product [Mycena citricolor]|uniref:DNA 3'-5' helicase n=1 Tax=Mycena citricolor TaxID=2018698 RepID=A0AAD2HJ86_9AGAR|nr:unnamed protein product [Mycena citricolor]
MASAPSKTITPTPIPTLLEIRAKALKIFGCRPCLWQIRVVEAVLAHDRDVITIAATGAGKTLTFWMPLLFCEDGIQIIVSPLNILGDQNVSQLEKLGIRAVNVTAETATQETFRDIEKCQYRVIVTNVETLMQAGGGFEKLWKKTAFTLRLISVIWDEAHCVSKWGGFRPEYKDAGKLRYLIPRSVPFVIVSATLPAPVLADVKKILQVDPDKCTLIRRSNDRANISLVIRQMKYPMSSFMDLAFLVPDGWKPEDPPPPKFLIFFDSITDSIDAAEYLRGCLPPEAKHRIKWFNSEMSSEFKVEEADSLKAGVTFGLACTDSFGMGLDLPDIALVIQWRATCDLCTLWQRFGRGARALGSTATALLLAEPKHFDENIKKARIAAEKRASARTKKRQPASQLTTPAPKHVALACIPNPNIPVSVPVPVITDSNPEEQEQLLVDHETAIDNRITVDDSEVILPDVVISSAEYLADRRRFYGAIDPVTNEPVRKQATRKKIDVLDPAMDDMINAATRQPGKPCFRLPPTIYFGNDLTGGDHMQCDAAGCKRCAPGECLLCCELCQPGEFAHFAEVSIPKPKQMASRSRVDKVYESTSSDRELQDALHTFRKNKTMEVFGKASLRNHGPGSIMSDEVLKRIVDCAHFHKLRTPDDLARETQWQRTNDDGDLVLSLVALHSALPPPPPPPTTPARSGPVTPQSASIPMRQCGVCGQLGHNRRNKLCPKFVPSTPATPSPADNENVPPMRTINTPVPNSRFYDY